MLIQVIWLHELFTEHRFSIAFFDTCPFDDVCWQPLVAVHVLALAEEERIALPDPQDSWQYCKSIAKVPFSFFFHQTAWSVLTLTMVSTRNDQHSVYDPIVIVGFSLITLKSNGTTRSRTVVSYWTLFFQFVCVLMKWSHSNDTYSLFSKCSTLVVVQSQHRSGQKHCNSHDGDVQRGAYSTYKVIKLYILMAGSGMSVICMDLQFVLHST